MIVALITSFLLFSHPPLPWPCSEKKSSTVHQKRRLSQGVSTLNSLSATSVDLTNKSNSSSGNVYTGPIPIQQAKAIQQQQQQQSGKVPASQAPAFAPGSASQVPITTASLPSSNSQSTLSTAAASANLARRKLPRTPETQQQPQSQLQATNLTNTPNALATNQINLPPHQQANKPTSQVLIQCWLDVERRELVVSLACAQLPRANTSTFCFGQIRILPPTL